MANKYYFRAADGGTRIPVTELVTYTGEMSGDYLRGNCYLRFFDGSGNPVTPTAGTITFDSSPVEDQFLMAPVVQTVNANEVIAGRENTATYTPPTFDSVVVETRMTLAGIAGATHVEAFHWRY